MKIKELPVSLYTAWYLNRIPLSQLAGVHKKQANVIVSLTTIPSRLSSLHLVIRSILNQSIRPKKIILWVHESLKNKLPKKLMALTQTYFEIRYTKGHASHRKLVHTLEAFPNTPIVTCDDDLLYPSNWLENLAQEATKYSGKILANQTRYIRYSNHGEVKPYKEWIPPETKKNPMATIGIGAGGVWYPINALHPIVTQESLYMALAPRADDLWFKAAAMLNNTETKQTHQPTPTPVPIIGSQRIALKKTNIGQDKNRTQWSALVQYFNFPTV